MKQLAEFKDKLYVRVFKAAILGGFRPEDWGYWRIL